MTPDYHIRELLLVISVPMGFFTSIWLICAKIPDMISNYQNDMEIIKGGSDPTVQTRFKGV